MQKELIFIRHGQGVHNTDVPDRLNIENPPLTERGRGQVAELKSSFTFSDDDLFIVSPTLRTIETTNIITSDLAHPQKYISPVVGPRMFPMPENPEAHFSKCDINYPLNTIQAEHSDFKLLQADDYKLWQDGINTMPEETFSRLGQQLFAWIRELDHRRTFIVAHDGTITCYRILLGEQGLTRADFLGEAGFHRTIL